LGDPEGEIQEREEGEVEGTVGRAGCSELDGYEEEDYQEEAEARVEGAEFGSGVCVCGGSGGSSRVGCGE
jgi:hypothetical protein